MTPELRLDADLTFSVSNPPMGEQPATVVGGRVTASGNHVDVAVDSLDAVSPGMSLRSASALSRRVARGLAEFGLSVSLSGPGGRIVTLGAVRPGFLQRVLTRSRHIQIDDWRTARTVVRKQTRGGPGLSLAEMLPPSTVWPPAPTFFTRGRGVSTTHDPRGGGAPRLVLSVGEGAVADTERRVFPLNRGVTSIGSDPSCDLVLDGLEPFHAEVRRDAAGDEYSLVAVGGATPTLVNGEQVDHQLLRTGSRLRIGEWTMAFAREEFADHGRPFGGRQGGEFSRQRPQNRPAYRR